MYISSGHQRRPVAASLLVFAGFFTSVWSAGPRFVRLGGIGEAQEGRRTRLSGEGARNRAAPFPVICLWTGCR